MYPEKFKERMKKLLGDDYGAFIEALERENAVRGVRINTLKADTVNLPYKTEKLSYAPDGYILYDGDGVGNTPEHHAGMIYVQDPGAMSSLNALDIKEDSLVIDLCSAPGGKSSQAAARIGDGGFILSNEYVPKRAKIVVENFERLGIRNAVVTSLDTSEIAKLYSAVFDLVIVDAPCSGEGMFRKSSEAVRDWSEENVLVSAKRQREILKNARGLVKAGGYLLYSTCTYSLEENEMNVDAFLSENPDFSLVPVKKELEEVTKPGILYNGCKTDNIELTRRFYPHVSPGEGQYVALMRRDDSLEIKSEFNFRDSIAAPTKEEKKTVEKFFSDNLREVPKGRLVRVNENLVFVNHNLPLPSRSVFSSGVLVGKVEKGILFPAHQFFSAYGTLFKRTLLLKRDDERLRKYLHGEEIDVPEIEDSGFSAVLYEGASLGGGKVSSHRLKNHYPKGLRTKQA